MADPEILKSGTGQKNVADLTLFVANAHNRASHTGKGDLLKIKMLRPIRGGGAPTIHHWWAAWISG